MPRRRVSRRKQLGIGAVSNLDLIDHLSGGRFILGLGPSGPQVIERWHGVPYGKPLTRTRDYVAIIRKILAREQPLEFHGEEYQIPATGKGTTGLGKPLKSILHGNPKAGGGKSLASFAVVPGVSVIVSNEPEKARMAVKGGMALSIGGMGARDKNFYNDLTKRLGFESEAARKGWVHTMQIGTSQPEALELLAEELL